MKIVLDVADNAPDRVSTAWLVYERTGEARRLDFTTAKHEKVCNAVQELLRVNKVFLERVAQMTDPLGEEE